MLPISASASSSAKSGDVTQSGSNFTFGGISEAASGGFLNAAGGGTGGGLSTSMLIGVGVVLILGLVIYMRMKH